MPPRKVANVRTKMQRPPFLQEGEKLYIRLIRMERSAKTTVAQQLAKQATNKTVRTWDQIVPP